MLGRFNCKDDFIKPDSSCARTKELLALSLYNSILKEDFKQVIVLLEKKKADPNYLLPQFGITPLHCGVGCGSENYSFKVVSYCLLHGGNPNVRCCEGTTPVILASFWGRADVLKLLLAFGGDPYISDLEGSNAFDYAKEKQFFHVLNCLKERPYKLITSLLPKSALDTGTQTSIRKSVLDKSLESTSEGSETDFLSCEEREFCDTRESNSNLVSISQGERTLCGIESDFSDIETSSKLDSCFIKVGCNNDIYSDIDSELNASEVYSTVDSHCTEKHSNQVISIQQNDSLIHSKDPESINQLSILPSDLCNNLNSLRLNCIKNDYVDFKNNFYKNSFTQKNVFKHVNNDNNTTLVNDIDLVNGKEINDEGIDRLNVGFIIHENKKYSSNVHDIKSILPVTDSIENIGEHSEDEESVLSEVNSSSYDTDSLRKELTEKRIFHGPLTKTTKKVYIRQLNRALKEKVSCPDFTYNFCTALIRTFSDNHYLLLSEWSHLETLMSEDFVKNSSKRKIDGGQGKVFFNYLLLDPELTDNLPFRAKQMMHQDVWKCFLTSIFYVGKGKHSRPYSHLNEALKQNGDKTHGKKVEKILSIWKKRLGVVCIQVFHNIISVEALTREAVMIDALNGLNLTNSQTGSYYGIVSTWNMKQKTQLGAVLLSRALGVFLAEGERQIFPHDLR